MPRTQAAPTSLLLLWLATPAPAQALVPAGAINDVVQRREAVFVVQDEPAVARYAEAIRKKFFAASRSLTDAEAAKQKLPATDLVVYGTPASAWLAAHAPRLPFRFAEGTIEIAGQKLAGTRLRVICAVKNPDDLARTALLYCAAAAADLVDINSVFHGPTGWVVADGSRVLASGEFPAAGPLTAEEQRKDLEYLEKTLAEVHPATAKGLPEPVAKALELAKQAAEPRSREQHWCNLQRVLVALHDAHTTLAPPQSGERLDLPLVWLAEGIVVREDRGDLKKGDLLLSLAGRDAAALCLALGEALPAENRYWLAARGQALLGDLGFLRALGIADAAPVPARIERDGRQLDVAVPLARPTAASRPATRPWVRFEIDEPHGLAVLTLDRCEVDDTYRNALRAFFTAVHEKRVGRVAVDLRANSGGNSAVLDEFLRYVDVEKYLSFAGDVRSSAPARAQRGLLAGLAYGGRPSERKNARHESPPPFRGELYVLVGGFTFSSGNWFAAVVQDNKIGKVVGEPTGNAPSSYGDVLSFQLPQSRFSFTTSFKRWIRPDPSRDPADTITPDVLVPRTRESVRDGKDPVLEHLRNAR